MVSTTIAAQRYSHYQMEEAVDPSPSLTNRLQPFLPTRTTLRGRGHINETANMGKGVRTFLLNLTLGVVIK
jgi:hypothetical protein